jgi:limonene-1,2-epoxide hydrolase
MTAKIDILLELIRVWNATQDIDRVLTFLDPDIVWHFSAVTQAPKRGHAGAREFLEGFKRRARNPQWRITDYAERGDMLFVEGSDVFETLDGVTVTIPYMGAYRFRDGRICAWRDYFDRGVADRGVAGEPLPAFARELVDRPAIIQGAAA